METYLTLEKLAPYLPYKLQMLTCKNLEGNDVVEELDCSYLDGMFSGIYCGEKPILRPLSDFASQITLGEIKKMLKCSSEAVYQIWELEDGRINIDKVYLETYNVMCRNHIDFNNLIKKGLAIDINTL